MSRIKPIWRIVLGFLFLMVVVYNSSMLAFGGNFLGFAVLVALFVVYVVFAIRVPYDDPLRSMRDLMAQQAAEEEERKRAEEEVRQKRLAAANAEASAREAARAAEAKERDEWNRTHGMIITPLAGVTFNNEDGSSRQALLKDYYARGGDADLDLEEYEYKGSPAIRVLLDGEQIGNIQRRRVADVSAVLDRIDRARLDVETFRPEEEEDEDGNVRRRGELIYRADLILEYKKDSEAGS